MNLENLKLMSIGSNCAPLNLLGEFRVKGPIDNCALARGLGDTRILFDNTLLDLINSTQPTILKRNPNFDGDNTLEYRYGPLRVVHNNPLTDKYKVEISKRMNNFLEFLQKVKANNKDYWFVYSLNAYDITPDRYANDLFMNGLDVLRKNGVLDKTIFIGTHWEGENWNFYMKNAKELGLHYIEVQQFNMWRKPKSETDFRLALSNLEI